MARVALGLSGLLLLGPLAPAAHAAPDVARAATFIDLGTAATYSVLGGTGVANTGAGTVLAADVGLSPAGAIAGFPPGTTAGTIHDKDPAAEQAQVDRQTAYDNAAGQTSTAAFAGDQGGKTFKPGVYTSAAAFTNTGTMTLDADGDATGVFIFQIGAAMSSAAASKVVLVDGALANNVYWQVVGAVTLGAGASYVGTFLAAGAISLGDGAKLKGRVLTPGAVALTNNPFAISKDDLTAPVVTIDGGANRSTNDTTPTISGTTDEPVGSVVTVTLAGQSLVTTVSAGGTWAVGATVLAAGPHNVVATVSDASQNVGTATQVLTVDVTAPVITIAGGPARATNDQTPAISGTTDEPVGSVVTVTVGGQTLTSPVAAAGAWSVQAATLAETSYAVVASVEDGSGSTGSASQVLTVDVTVPVVTIDGGANRSTDDTSPWTYGTTGEQVGTVVHVSVGGQDLEAIVRSGGLWGVSAMTLPEGPHSLLASITDAAGNVGTASQTLTVTGSGPVVDPVVDPVVEHRPDAAIRKIKGKFIGVGVYNAAKQRASAKLTSRVRSATFEVRVTNRGDEAERMSIRATPRNRAFKVIYLAGGKNVTKAITAGTYRTGTLQAGESVGLIVKVTRTKTAKAGSKRAFLVRYRCAELPIKQDVVSALVRV